MKRPPEVLTAQEVRQLLVVCSRRAPSGVRNRALIAVLYRSGLRLSEALELAPRDVDQVGGALHVRHGKGDRARVVGIDGEALALLDTWLVRRGTLGLRSSYVFCTLAGRRLQPSYVRTLLPRLARRAGLDKRVHAHGLRHSHAAELAREGVQTHVIQAQLGHSSLATTDRYVRHLEPGEVLERMRARTGWSSK